MADRIGGKDSLFSLFKGDIPGEVANSYTGNIHKRKDVMNHYHHLLIRSVKDPANVKLRNLVSMIAEVLEIPSDIHQSLIIEAWRDKGINEPPDVDIFIKADMEAMFDIRTGQVFVDTSYPPLDLADNEMESGVEKRSGTGLMDHHTGVYDQAEVERYSLLSEMEEDDISLDQGSSIMDDTSKDSPFYSEGWEKKNGGKKAKGQSLFND